MYIPRYVCILHTPKTRKRNEKTKKKIEEKVKSRLIRPPVFRHSSLFIFSPNSDNDDDNDSVTAAAVVTYSSFRSSGQWLLPPFCT